MSVINNPSERNRFLRFGVVGAIGSVVDFGILNLLTTLIGLPFVLSSIISFSAAVINNFILNRVWTFPESRHVPVAKQLSQFAVVSLVGLGIRTPLLAGLERVLISLSAKYLPNFLSPTIVGHNVGLAIAILVVLLWNFFANRYWTFRDFSHSKDEPHES